MKLTSEKLQNSSYKTIITSQEKLMLNYFNWNSIFKNKPFFCRNFMLFYFFLFVDALENYSICNKILCLSFSYMREFQGRSDSFTIQIESFSWNYRSYREKALVFQYTCETWLSFRCLFSYHLSISHARINIKWFLRMNSTYWHFQGKCISGTKAPINISQIQHFIFQLRRICFEQFF